MHSLPYFYTWPRRTAVAVAVVAAAAVRCCWSATGRRRNRIRTWVVAYAGNRTEEVVVAEEVHQEVVVVQCSVQAAEPVVARTAAHMARLACARRRVGRTMVLVPTSHPAPGRIAARGTPAYLGTTPGPVHLAEAVAEVVHVVVRPGSHRAARTVVGAGAENAGRTGTGRWRSTGCGCSWPWRRGHAAEVGNDCLWEFVGEVV